MDRSAACGAEVDAQLPVMGEELGLALGAGVYRDAFPWGGENESHVVCHRAAVAADENFELRPFFSHIKFSDEESEPLMLTAGGVMPPKIEREHYYGQSWATNEGEVLNYGVIGAARFGALDGAARPVRVGLAPDAQFAELFTDIDASRNANEMVVAFPSRDSRRNRASCACRACSRRARAGTRCSSRRAAGCRSGVTAVKT